MLDAKQIVDRYIKREVVADNSDWKKYEEHKRKLEIMTGGNSYFYEYGLKKVIEKMGI